MGKFIGLVKNEYIKLIRKTGTWVMLVILLVSSVGLSAIALYAQKYEGHDSYDEGNMIEDYQSEIDYLKNVKTDGWEQEVERNQYLIDNLITPINDVWRMSAANIMFDIKYGLTDYKIKNADSVISAIDNAIKNDDWKSYFETACVLSDENPGIIDEAEISVYKKCLDENIAPYGKNWRYTLMSQLESDKLQLKNCEAQKAAGQSVDISEMKLLDENCKKYQYRLDNNIDFDISENTNWMDGNFNFWSVFGTSTSIVSFISVMVIIIAGGIVSGEFSSGTIKFLMINPVKRWKILASKYFTAMTFGYIAMFVVYIISMLTTMLFFGAENLGASYITVSGDKVSEISGFLYIAKLYLINSVSFVVMGSLAFAISSLFRSSALAIGISVMAYTGGSTVTMVLSQLQFDWGRYLIFSNLDLVSISEGHSMFTDQTVGMALAVIAVHMIIFLLTAWDGFTRREV